MNEPLIEIHLMPWAKAMPQARPLRQTVFVNEQRVPVELEWDEWDEPSVHALALTGRGGMGNEAQSAVGTGRLLPADAGGSARLGRMAVLADWRGRSLGKRILAALLAEARWRGVKRVDIHAQVSAAEFYRRAGFVQSGEPFDEAGIAHVAMSKSL